VRSVRNGVRLLLALFCVAAAPAHAYCIYNQLADREVRVEQETHPDPLRNERRLLATIKPGANHCCAFHRLDCNPGGRNNSVVNIAITIAGEPVYECGFPAGAEPNVKVTGSGTIRILRNPRAKSADPYIVRVRTHDRQDLTGPKGLACPESRSKGKK
jgi:hypothetical protein